MNRGTGPVVVELAWGPAGAASLAADGALVVVIDVLAPTSCGADMASALPAANGAVGLAASLRNRGAVVARLLASQQRIGLVPAGEWTADGGWRPAYEDLLGAGAIVAGLLEAAGAACSPAATAAHQAYAAAGDDVRGRLIASRSGAELIAAGLAGDLDAAGEQDVDDDVPTIPTGGSATRP
jgi:2-phosphosulfolactate phosphatase